MLFSLPFAKPAGWSVQKVIVIGLITVHCLWIGIHLTLVSRAQINPWKLGGYGMYTTVDPRPKLFLFDKRSPRRPIPNSTINWRDYVKQNLSFMFRCRPPSEQSFDVFFRGNPKLIGSPLKFVVTERKIEPNPIRPVSRTHSVFEITWIGQRQFKYFGKVCDEYYHGEIELGS